MSIDVSVFLYFPVSRAEAALNVVRKVLRRRKYALGILVEPPSGEPIRIPATAEFRNQVEVNDPDGMRLVEAPTISEVFPEVHGTEPVFALGEKTRLDGLSVEIAYRKAGKVVDSLPVSFSLARGRDYLEVSFGNLTSSDATQFHSLKFRSRIAKIFGEAGGVVAVYLVNGEWSSFADHSPIEDPGGENEKKEIDAFVEFLVEQTSG
jgi:hypothetical protein